MNSAQCAKEVAESFATSVGVGLRLRSVRERRKMTLDEFSRSIEISRSSLYNYEKGRRDLTVSVLRSLEQNLGIDPTWLVTGNIVQTQPLKDVFEEHSELIERIVKIENAKGYVVSPTMAYDTAAAALLVARDTRGQGDSTFAITDASLEHLIEIHRQSVSVKT